MSALYATPDQIVQAAADTGTFLAPGFFVGVAQVESLNNINNSEPRDQTGGSYGIYAIGPGAGREVESELGFSVTADDLLDLDFSTTIFAELSEARAWRLLDAAGLDSMDQAPPDIYPFLELAHNRGVGAAIAAVQRYGIDWAAYAAANPSYNFVASSHDQIVIDAVAAYGPAIGSGVGAASRKGWYVAGAVALMAGVGVLLARS